MSTGIITSFTLIDFPSESEMTAFFVFFENNIEALADELRANGMTKFYVSRVFNKGDKYTIGNWLEYEDQTAFAACDKIWQQFLAETSDKFNFVSKVVPYRGIVQYDFS